jgi:hypothetical protein
MHGEIDMQTVASVAFFIFFYYNRELYIKKIYLNNDKKNTSLMQKDEKKR